VNLWHFGEQVRRVNPGQTIKAGSLIGPAHLVAERATYGELVAAGYLEEVEPDVDHPHGWEREPVADVEEHTGRPVAVLVPAGPPPLPPEPSIEEALLSQEHAVRQHSHRLLEAAAGLYVWPEASGWSQLAEEAGWYIQNGTIGPMLAAEVVGLEPEKIMERCANIEEKAAAFTAARGAIVQARQAQLAAVREFAESEGVTGSEVRDFDPAAASLAWPELG
jgi:hypothetical protein